MANIGKVYKDSYKGKDGKDVPILTLDIRTISTRKKMTISVNKMKWESGKVGVGDVISGKEEHPDYHIWYNMSSRGESIPSEIVGNIRNMVSDSGLKYKKGSIFDPFIQKEAIYFTMFEIEETKKLNPNELYNVVSQPYRRVQNTTHNTQQATPNYATQQNEDNEPPLDYYDDEEIPF
jgi:hypothetical protein